MPLYLINWKCRVRFVIIRKKLIKENFFSLCYQYNVLDGDIMQETQKNELIYGKNAVVELLKSGTPVDTVWISEGLETEKSKYFYALAKQAGAVVKKAPTAKLNLISGVEHHQGILAFVAPIIYASLDDILQSAKEKEQPPLILFLDGIEDPHNLGALLRTAFLCGAHGVVIPKRGSASLTPIVMKASAGAALHIPIARVPNISQAIRYVKQAGVFVYCADIEGVPFYKENLSGALGLVLGAEGKGVSTLVAKLCDGSISIPMNFVQGTHVDSFNVSVAGGILLYDVFKKRQEL